MKRMKKRVIVGMLFIMMVIGTLIPTEITYASTDDTEPDIIFYLNTIDDFVTINKVFSVNEFTYYVIPKSNKIKSDQVIVAGYTGNKTKVMIPETVSYENKKYTVTKVGNNYIKKTVYWRVQESQWGTTVNTIVLPDTINEICDNTFINVTSLKNINIPKNVKYICDSAFSNTQIEKLILPKNLELFENSQNMNMLKTIIVDKNNKFYKASNGCLFTKDGKTLLFAPAVNKCIIPKSVTTIDGAAFFSNIQLKSVTIPKNVENIEDKAFEGCTKLTNVKMENGTKSIGDQAFGGCNNLKNINLPNSITNMGSNVFEECTSLESLNIPNKIAKINHTVDGCTNLKTIEIPDSVVEIDTSLWGCSKLEKIVANKVENRKIVTSSEFYYLAIVKKVENIDSLIPEEAKEHIKILEDFYNTVNNRDSEVMKVKKAHDWLIKDVEYDDYAVQKVDTDPFWSYTDDPHTAAWSVEGLFENKQVVCAGYADAMVLLCELLDIECIKITSTTEMRHMWNLVKVDGQWYQLDATWDDLEGDRVGYKYFLISDKQMAIDHQWDKSEEYPACNNTITNYQ